MAVHNDVFREVEQILVNDAVCRGVICLAFVLFCAKKEPNDDKKNGRARVQELGQFSGLRYICILTIDS